MNDNWKTPVKESASQDETLKRIVAKAMLNEALSIVKWNGTPKGMELAGGKEYSEACADTTERMEQALEQDIKSFDIDDRCPICLSILTDIDESIFESYPRLICINSDCPTKGKIIKEDGKWVESALGVSETKGLTVELSPQEVELLKMALDWSDWTGHRLKLKENLLKKLESLEEGRK